MACSAAAAFTCMATRASGKDPSEFPDLRQALVLGVARGNERWPFHQFAGYRAEPGDMIVSITSDPSSTAPPDPTDVRI